MGLGSIRSVCSFARGSFLCIYSLVTVGVVFLTGDVWTCWSAGHGIIAGVRAGGWERRGGGTSARPGGTGVKDSGEPDAFLCGRGVLGFSCGDQRPRPDRQVMGLCRSLHSQGVQVAFRMIAFSDSGWGFSMGAVMLGSAWMSSRGGAWPRLPTDDNEVCSPRRWSREACEGNALKGRLGPWVFG